MPFALVSGGAVRAHTMKTPAYEPPVIHCFAPSITHVVAVSARGRPHPSGIAPRVGLAQREAPGRVLAAGEARAVVLLLRVGPEPRDGLAHHVRDAHHHGGRRARTRDLLHRQRVRDDTGLGAAELGRDVDRHESEVGQALEDLAREPLGRVDVGGLRGDDARGEVARGLLDEELRLVEVEVHGKESHTLAPEEICKP